MSTHATVLKLSASLGHTNTPGRCHGFSLRWIEACLLGEEHRFAERINTIISGDEGLANSIQAVKEKKGLNLTEKDETLLDILAFYESMELYHNPKDYFSLFKVPLGQQDIEALSYFASSNAIKSLGGLVRIYSEPGIYTKEEIKEYLNSLSLILESTYTVSKEPLGIVLSSNSHTIALTYKPAAGWGFMDINQYPSLAFKIYETDLLAERIVESFKSDDSPYSAFNTSVFTTGKHLQLCNLKEKLEQFVTSPQLTKEMAGRIVNEIGLTYIAACHGHVSLIAELEKYGADLNKATHNGATPTFIAACHGHVSVITELEKYGADLNKATRNGATPIFIAAQRGHAPVIAELAKHERVDFNKANDNGETPAHIAAKNGHASVIAELAKYERVDFNKANNGETPAHIAARNGFVSVIAELAKHERIDFNKANDNGETPVHIAAKNGHASVIAELAKHERVDFNKANDNGETPAHIAAKNGHASVIAELAKYERVDFNKANNGETPAHIAARNGFVSVIAELAKHERIDFNKANDNGETPAHIAAENGHVSVIVELAKCDEVDFNKANNNGETPAHIAVYHGHAPVITELAKYGVNLDLVDNDGKTPVFTAASPIFGPGDVLLITTLANHEANLDIANNNGQTPAFMAAHYGDASVVAELIRLGANFNIHYTASANALEQFVSAENQNVIARMKQYIKHQAPERQTISMTPYLIAFIMGHDDIIRLLAEDKDFNQAVAQISSEINNVDLRIRPYLTQLVTQINALKKGGGESVADLTQVLLAIYERLHHKDDVESYKNLAENLQRRTSPEMTILGEIMIELGAEIAALGVIITASFVSLNPLIINAETQTTATALSFFNPVIEKKPSMIMDDSFEQQSLSDNPNSCSGLVYL